ncbi:PTS transporter subunit EIIC [Collinsella aerofaciens]|uniref:PTS transporter subunit EIIC n=1 Tax=Collinsella aerofaciens TaxID=74426 RepID=UPI003561ADBE
MKYQKLCDEIITKVGGRDNVLDVSHCITRLRFHLKDESLAQTNELKATKGVVDVIQAGGQYQVVIGATVEAVYNDLVQIGGFDSKPALDIDEGDDVKKGDPFSRLLAIISEILQPVLGVLMAGGFIKSMLALCTVAGWLAKDSNTYVTLSAIGDSVFYYFPLIIGWTSAKKFGLKPVMGMALGGILVYPTLVVLMGGDPLYTLGAGTVFESNVYGDIFGIPLIMQNYSSTILPAIFIVWIASKVHKALSNALPALVSSFFSNIVAQIILMLINFQPAIAGFVIGTFWSLLVMFGLHWGIIPLWFLDVATYGYDLINPLVYAGGCAIAGAVLGMIIRTKDSEENAAVNIPALVSSIFGVNEPALYAILLPRKRLMWATFISAGVGGAIAGLMGAKLYAFGASGPLGFPSFINPAGIDTGIIGLVISGVVAFVLALVAAMVIGTKKDEGGKALNISVD